MKLADINQAVTIEPSEDAIPLGEEIRCPASEGQEAPQTTSACYDVRSELDSLELVSVEPTPGTQLQVGSTVTVRAEVRYVLDSHEEMETVLSRSKLDSRGMASIETASVSRGSDTVIIAGEFEVPDLSEVQISVALFPPLSVVQAAGYECWRQSITIMVETYGTS